MQRHLFARKRALVGALVAPLLATGTVAPPSQAMPAPVPDPVSAALLGQQAYDYPPLIRERDGSVVIAGTPPPVQNLGPR